MPSISSGGTGGGRTVLMMFAATAGIMVFSALAFAERGHLEWSSFFFLGIALSVAALMLLFAMVNRERKRSAELLDRVYEAMSAVSANPELEPTLQVIADGATDAVHVHTVTILLVEGDDVYMYALSGTDRRRELVVPPKGSPLAHVLATGEMVVMQKPMTDERFRDWLEAMKPTLEQQGIECGVIVPLCTDEAIVGVLVALFQSPSGISPDNLRLLNAYVEQAALVIVRALAFERERELLRRLFEADQLKSQFLAHVSHELRTPLTATKGFVDTLLEQWPSLSDEQRVDMLTRAGANADVLARLIDRLLEYSTIENDYTLDWTDAELLPMVRDVVSGVRPALHGCPVEVDIPHDLVVRVDRHAFSHMLTNLLTNAARYSPAGSPVRVSAAREDGEILLFVSDDGPGIALDDQERIFERFVRVAPAPGARGTGLGLAIVRRCAEALDGRIWVESEVGAGATFVVAFPIPGPPQPEQVEAAGGLTSGPAPAKLDQPV